MKGTTAAQLTAFRKRNEDARRKVIALSEQPTEIDFAYYRSVLKNKAVVDEIEKSFKAFSPVKIDVSKTIAEIEQFEKEAIKNAEETKGRVETELQELSKTLANIEEARPFDELTVDEVAAARPDIDKRTEQMVTKHKWMPPGYKVRFIGVKSGPEVAGLDEGIG